MVMSKGAVFESSANACHAQTPTGDFPGHSYTGFAKGQVGSGQKQAGPAGGQGIRLVSVLNHQLCTRDAFGKKR